MELRIWAQKFDPVLSHPPVSGFNMISGVIKGDHFSIISPGMFWFYGVYKLFIWKKLKKAFLPDAFCICKITIHSITMRKNYNSAPEDIKFILKIIGKYKEIFIKRILGFPSPLVMLSLSKICTSDFMSVFYLPLSWTEAATRGALRNRCS